MKILNLSFKSTKVLKKGGDSLTYHGLKAVATKPVWLAAPAAG